MYPLLDLRCSIKKGTLTLAGARDVCRANVIKSHSDAQLADEEVQGRDESIRGSSKEKSITKAYIRTKEEHLKTQLHVP